MIPGVVGATGDGAGAIATAPFRGGSAPPCVVEEEGLVLAWSASAAVDVHRDDRTACLIDGCVHDLAGRGPASARNVARVHAAGTAGLPGALKGEYWAVLWDRAARRGFVATDHMGVHAPYWARRGAGIVFASDLPLLLDALPAVPDPDLVAMAHWLVTSVPPDGRSLYRGVRRLPAGHVLDLGPATTGPRRYWALTSGPPGTARRDEVVGRLRETLATSVARRVPATGETGVLLSGGLDSSVVAALAASRAEGSGAVHAYSATFPNHPSVDESRLIDLTATRLGLPATRIDVRGGSAIRGALAYLDAWRVPPTSPNLFFWTPLLQRAADDGVRVMLDGEGGDELFGLSPFLLADRLVAGRLPSMVRLAGAFPGSATARARARRLRRFGLAAALPAPAHDLLHRARGSARFAPPWMRPEVADVWLATQDFLAWKRLPGPRWHAYLVYAVVLGGAPALVYEQARRRAAQAGVAARHPLVDPDVIELVLGTDPELAFDARFNRPLLRDAAAGLLPDEVRLRPAKSSFDTLFHAALRGPDLPVARRLLAGGARVGAYVDLPAVRAELFERPPPPPGPGLAGWAVRLWRLVMAECWLRSRDDPSFPRRLATSEGLAGPDHELLTGRR